MGTPKQLLRLGARTLLRTAVEEALASGARATFVVVGSDAAVVAEAVRDLPVTVVENARWADGIGTSVSAGIARVADDQPPFAAAVLMTCDQPHVSAATIHKLIAEHSASAKRLVASAYGGTMGVPALFAREYFDALRELSAEKGAKEILLRHPDEVATVEFAAGSLDLDTPADYEQALRGGVTS